MKAPTVEGLSCGGAHGSRLQRLGFRVEGAGVNFRLMGLCFRVWVSGAVTSCSR